MGHLDAPLMTLNEEPQGQIFTHIKETYISVQHINYEENEPSTEKKKPQMCRKSTITKKMAMAAILFF